MPLFTSLFDMNCEIRGNRSEPIFSRNGMTHSLTWFLLTTKVRTSPSGEEKSSSILSLIRSWTGGERTTSRISASEGGGDDWCVRG